MQASKALDIEAAFGVVCIEVPTPFPVGPANVYLIKADPPMLVDAGIRTGEAYETVTNVLREHGYAPADLGAIIITHGHRDHMGLLGRLLDESSAKAYAHPLVSRLGQMDSEFARARRDFYVAIIRGFGVPDELQDEANSLYERFRAFSDAFKLDHEFEDGVEILGLTPYFVPGHAPSDTLLVDHAKGMTYVGDHILQTSNPNPLLRRTVDGKPRAKALVEYRASLRRSRELELGVCLPGHGPPFDDHVSVIDGILSKHDKRTKQVFELVARGLDTPYAVSRSLFPKLPMQNIHLGLSIAVGHLELLEEDGRLKSSHDNGVLRFFLQTPPAEKARIL